MKFITCFVIFTLLSVPALAWKVVSACTKINSTLTLKLEGEVRPPLAADLAKLTISCKALQRLELRFDSPGGALYEALAIVSEINKLKEKGVTIVTRVNNGDECDSICVPLYAQGNIRQAGPVAAFMVHGVAVFAISNIPDPAANIQLFKLLKAAPELNEEWLQGLILKDVFSKPSMYWLSGKELLEQKSGLVLELLERQQLTQPYDKSYRQF